jgi:hypothetical protein
MGARGSRFEIRGMESKGYDISPLMMCKDFNWDMGVAGRHMEEFAKVTYSQAKKPEIPSTELELKTVRFLGVGLYGV